MAEAVDFKKVNSRGYRAWRILSSPDFWPSFYTDRVKKFGNYQGAIIFPEQLLGLKDQTIYMVRVSRNENRVTSEFTALQSHTLYGGYDELKSLESIREFETHNTPRDPRGLNLGQKYNNMDFGQIALFTNTKSAMKYQMDEQTRRMSYIG